MRGRGTGASAVAAMLVLGATAVTLAGQPVRRDVFDGLPFRVSPTDTLKIAGRVSNLLVLTESGSIRPQGADACVFVVGSSRADEQVTDLRTVAERRARETEMVSGVQIVEGRERAIGGLPGYEIFASATDTVTGRVLTLYQMLLQDDESYVLMQGIVVEPRAGVMVPEFQRVAASFVKPFTPPAY
jgi:hypothetical protein